MSNEAERNPPVTRMRVDFISRGQVISRYPIVIRADGDLFKGIKSAYEWLRKEHPTLNASDDIEVSAKYENEGPQVPGDRSDPEVDLLLDHQRHALRESQGLCATSRKLVADSERLLVRLQLESRRFQSKLSESERLCRDTRALVSISDK